MALWQQNLLTFALTAAVTFEILSLWSYAFRETMMPLPKQSWKSLSGIPRRNVFTLRCMSQRPANLCPFTQNLMFIRCSRFLSLIFPSTVYDGHVILPLLLRNERLIRSAAQVNASWNMSKRASVHEFAWVNTPATRCAHSGNLTVAPRTFYFLLRLTNQSTKYLLTLISYNSKKKACWEQFSASLLPRNIIARDRNLRGYDSRHRYLHIKPPHTRLIQIMQLK